MDPREDSEDKLTGQPAGGVVDPDSVPQPNIAKEDQDPQKQPFDADGYQEIDFYENLASKLSPKGQNDYVSKYLKFLEFDKTGREKRDKQYEEGVRRTGLSDDAPGGADFLGASKVVHPGLTKACVDFGARTMKELMAPGGPVRIQIDGKLTKAKIDRAERKRKHMNWQFTKQIREYRPNLEKATTQAALAGASFIKWYPDMSRKRPACEFIRLDQIHFPIMAPDFFTASRVFHEDQNVSKFEFERRVKAGIYEDPDMLQREVTTGNDGEQPTKTQEQMNKVDGVDDQGTNEDEERTIIDCYIYEDFDFEDRADKDLGSPPYVMTIDKSTEKVVGLYRNWDEEDKTQQKMDWINKYGFIPWDSALELGLATLVGKLSGAATGSLRALLDAALTATIPTGITLKGTTVTGQSTVIGPARMNELKNRAIPGMDDVRKLFMQIPFQGPSPVMLSLLQFLDEQLGQMIKTTQETADANTNMPVGTKLASIEQALTVYSAIHQRFHEAQRRDLEIVHRINRMYMDDKPFDPNLGFAVQPDYEDEIDVQPASDPNIYSDSQRFGQIQAVFQLAETFPNIYDVRAINRWALAVMKIPNVEEILPDQQAPKDHNPVAENVMMSLGQPAIALPDQDHPAHLKVLLSFAASPALGSNPIISNVFAPLAVQHAKQHILYWYAALMNEGVEKALGMSLSSIQDDDIVVSQKFSELVASLSQPTIGTLGPMIAELMPVVQQMVGIAQQVQAAQQTQNPQMAELKLMSQEVANQTQATQIKKDQADAKAVNDQENIAVKREGIQAKMEQVAADNQTAKEIAAVKAVTGKGVGSLKDGESFGAGPSFKRGGPVQQPGLF